MFVRDSAQIPIEEEIHVAASHLFQLLEEIMAEAYFRSAMAQWEVEVNLTHSANQDTVKKKIQLTLYLFKRHFLLKYFENFLYCC